MSGSTDGKGAIAIVDDSEELRFLLSLLVRMKLKLPCLALSSLAEARAQAGNLLDSAIVVLDINLGYGEPDGLDIYDWLREQGFGGQVFFLTGHAADNPRVKEAEQTGVRILEKPLPSDRFVEILQEALATPGAER